MGLLNIEMTPELFERSIKGSPRDAIKELIWNACDADATRIDISFGYDGLEGAESVSDIYVRDNGHGVPFNKVAEYFGKYGRSQKTYSEKSPGGRVFHGKLGQGRYKTFAIGSFAEWETTFKGEDGFLYSYVIGINAGSRMEVRISDDAKRSNNDCSGTVVHIHGLHDKKIKTIYKLTENSDIIPEILATFAPYLLAYSGIEICYNGILLDPNSQIVTRREKMLVYDGKQNETETAQARAVLIQWKQSKNGKLYICGESGVVYDERDYTPLNRYAISIYLLGRHFEVMHRENTLTFGLADSAYAYFDTEAKKFAKEFIEEQQTREAADEIRRIKESGLYPYPDEGKDGVAKAEQDVFDMLAVQINRAVPQLRSANRQTKKLTYQLMREAINTNPSSIKTILTEVFKLTQRQQDDLAELMTHTKLPEIIDVAKTVSDRLTFIYLLEQMVYNDSIGKPIKERTQFHKILLNELWIFGEKYELGTSDQSLNNLLKAHIRKLGRSELIPEIPQEAAKDLARIPDICLFEQICPGYEQYEHLVIELKRPTLTLTKKEIDQIEDYALTVSDNPLFDKDKTKWHFILLGQKFDTYVINRLKNRTQGVGNLFNSDDGSVAISVLMWSTIIQENKFKYEYLRKKLNHELSSDPAYAMDYLLQKHAELFPEKSEGT